MRLNLEAAGAFPCVGEAPAPQIQVLQTGAADIRMSALTRKEPVDRGKIHLTSAAEVKGWAHRLKITPQELRSVVEKVGNSAAAVRKELATEVDNGIPQR